MLSSLYKSVLELQPQISNGDYWSTWLTCDSTANEWSDRQKMRADY